MPFEDEGDALRRLLARKPRPELAADFAPRLMRRVRERERAARRRPRPSTRVVLALYWLAAALASAWILRDASLLPWVSALAGLAALLAVPAGFAIALWPSQARVWLAFGIARFFPPRTDLPEAGLAGKTRAGGRPILVSRLYEEG